MTVVRSGRADISSAAVAELEDRVVSRMLWLGAMLLLDRFVNCETCGIVLAGSMSASSPLGLVFWREAGFFFD